MPFLPDAVFSAHATHGEVIPPGVSVPAATRGFSASWSGLAFSEQSPSASALSAHGPNRCALELSRMPEPSLPTALEDLADTM